MEFNNAPSSFQEALQQFDLSWDVGLRPIWTADKDGQLKMIPGYRSVNRLDKDIPLSVVGSRYEVAQNNRCAALVDEVVKSVGGKYVNGGLFGSGEKLFMQVQFPDSIKLHGSKDDTIKKYLCFVSSHDASLPTVLGASSTRVVCCNTFMMAFKDARRDIRIRHTSNSELRLAEAKDILKAMLDYHAKVELKVNQLAATKFTDMMMNETLRNMFNVDPKITSLTDLPTRTQNSMSTVLEHFANGKGIDQSNRGTAYAAWNSLTEYSNWDKTVKNEKTDGMARTESLLIGSGAEFNLRALSVVEQVAGLLA